MNQNMNTIGQMGMWNRYPQMNSYSFPHYEAPQLRGKADAYNFAMSPNSEIFLPDATEDLIWWIKTDAQGTKTVIPLDISVHKDPEPVDLQSIESRLTKMEELINAKFNKQTSKRNSSATVDATAVE